jgi:C1A family cysteine protease
MTRAKPQAYAASPLAFNPFKESTMASKKTSGASKKRAELNRICNVVPSRGTEKDWQFADAQRSAAIGSPVALPPSVDLRAAWWAIGNQEDTGSCVGWASTDGVLRYHLVKAGRLAQTERLSPRATWMASKETDEFTTRPQTFIEEFGTSLKAAMDICRRYGVVPESMLPFHIATKMYTGNENTFYATAAQRRCASYFNLQKNTAQWKNWLATQGPIMAALNVDASWDNAAATKGLITSFKPNTVRGGHAICVVGYRSDGRFIVRNSWGTAWGDKGFGYVAPAYVAAGFFSESYGITL